MALADQRREPRLNDRALPLGNTLGVDALDESVDDDEPERSAILELLRRNRDAHENESVRGVGLLDRIGRGEHLRDGYAPAADSRGDRVGLGRKFRKASLDRDVPDGDGQLRSVGRRRQPRRTGNGDRPRRARRRGQGGGRHARWGDILRIRAVPRRNERQGENPDRPSPLQLRKGARFTRTRLRSSAQTPASPLTEIGSYHGGPNSNKL